MKAEDIVTKLIELFDMHFSNNIAVVEHQWKIGFFELFQEAYKSGYIDRGTPLLTADALSEIIAARWHTGDEEQDSSKTELTWKILNKWGEWKYALDNFKA